MASTQDSGLRPKSHWWGLLFPPCGMLRAWDRSELPFWRKLLTTLLYLLYLFPYMGILLAVVIQLGVVDLEWQGGFPPVLTWNKTEPDYGALESHRQSMASATNTPVSTDPPESASRYWSGFRGPERNGHYREMPIRTQWPPSGLDPLWKQPIGGGYGSFSMADGRAYTLEQRRELEAVTCYDILSGQELWAHAYPARFQESMGGEGPRSTPTWDEGRVYALGATGHFHCLNADSGEVLWSRQVLEAEGADNIYFGCSASPLIVEDKVIVVGGQGGPVFMALDKLTGDKRWQSVPGQAAYMSPMLVEFLGQRQILAATATDVLALTPEEGRALWRFPWEVQHDLTIAQPLITGTNTFVVSSGYGKGAAMVSVERTDEGSWEAESVWTSLMLKNKFTSSVLHEGYIYGLDESILTCIDASTGRRQWKDGRYGYGQLLLADGHLIILSGTGDLVLVRANPDAHEELASFAAIEGKTWNHPALGGGYLLVRNAVEMACFDLRLR